MINVKMIQDLQNFHEENIKRQTEMSKMFFMEILTAFLERVKPDSTKVNPACMKKTKIPDKRIHSMVKSSLTSTAVVELISERFNIICY